MPLIYPNIVPANNLRLPDALTVKHGPARLLSRAVLEGDKAARRLGVTFRIRHDFEELLYLNRHEVANGTWFRLVDHLNPEYCDLTPENSYWISGEDERGEIVITQANRIYYWPDTDLAQEARLMFYAGRDQGQLCEVKAEAAKLITGVVMLAGARWVRPDFRGHFLSHLIPRLGRAYALARWPIDWVFGFMAPVLIDKGLAQRYGYPHVSRSLFFPGSPWGDLEVVLVAISTTEAYDDLANFMTLELSGSDREAAFGEAASPSIFEDSVTRISSEEVFQGSSSRS